MGTKLDLLLINPGSRSQVYQSLGHTLAAVENPVSVHDFHATMLFLLGIDAAKLAVKYQGLDVRLTGPEGGAVVRDIIT